MKLFTAIFRRAKRDGRNPSTGAKAAHPLTPEEQKKIEEEKTTS